MEFVVSRNSILSALNHARRAMNPKYSTEILKNFLFTFPDEANPDKMTVQAGDGWSWISETISIQSFPSSVDAPGPFRPFAVYFNDLLRPIKSLEDQPLMFRVTEYQLSVHHSCGSFRIPLFGSAMEIAEYPKPNPDADAPDGCRFEYEVPCLRSVLTRCKFAMAQDDLRPVMNGVCMNLTEEFSDYVASDGHKLVRVRKKPVCYNGSLINLSVIIPSSVVNMLLRVLPTTGDVVFEYQEKMMAARIIINDNLMILFNPVDGKYPRYMSVIPESFSYKMTVERRSLIKSIDRLNFFSNSSSNMIRMGLTQNELCLNAEDTDFDLSGEEKLPCKFVKQDGSDAAKLSIGIKATSLSDTLKALSTEEVIFNFTDETRAFVIYPKPQPDVEDITMLLMPMLIG